MDFFCRFLQQEGSKFIRQKNGNIGANFWIGYNFQIHKRIGGNALFKKCKEILLLWTLEQLEKKLYHKGYTFVYLPTSLGSNQSWIPIHKVCKDNSIFDKKLLVNKLHAIWWIKKNRNLSTNSITNSNASTPSNGGK